MTNFDFEKELKKIINDRCFAKYRVGHRINSDAFVTVTDANDKKEEKPEEEWVWVTGYKGTNRNMQCRNNYQFEIGKKFDMPEDADISVCSSGFHFCTEMKDVFNYYGVLNGNRFFEVRALVKKEKEKPFNYVYVPVYAAKGDSKKAAKSIILTRELTVDEILVHTGVDISDWTEEDKANAIEKGIDAVKRDRALSNLIKVGYSEAFARLIIKRDRAEEAYAVGTQKDLSMDMKVAIIFNLCS